MNAPPAPGCILFDLDGTLVDSVADISASANYVRGTLGMEPLDEAELARYVGDGAPMLIRRALTGRYDAPEDPAGFDLGTELRKFRAHYHEHCLGQTRTYPGVVEALRALAPLPLAIVSNKPEPMCVTIAAGLGLAPLLGAVIGARPGVPVKPDPALLQIALDELGRPAGPDVWMVGDSRNDILAARAIGATAVAVSWGLSDVAALRELGPEVVLERIGDLARRVA